MGSTRTRWVNGCAAALLFLAAAPLALAADPVRIKLAMIAPKGSIFYRVALDIGEAFRKAEGPGSAFLVYPDGSQGGEADVVRRMRIGQLNGAMLTVIGLSEIDPSSTALGQIPMLFRSSSEVEYVGQALRSDIDRKLADQGFVAVLWSEAGWVRFFCRHPAVLPQDLKEQRMFAWAGDGNQIEVMKQLGYRPVVLETGDIVPGLQTGLIDAVPLTPIWALAAQVDRIAPYMIDVRWGPIVGAVVFTRRVWEAMSPAAREAIQAAAAKAGAELRAYQERADAEAIAAMEKRGLHVQRLSAEQEKAWQGLAQQTYPMLRGRSVPAASFDEAVRRVAQYRRDSAHP
jgi:TRAP-type C4-dicarboxylate transport system substrate-binding protein